LSRFCPVTGAATVVCQCMWTAVCHSGKIVGAVVFAGTSFTASVPN
jgi:hypothetical protein